VNGEYVYVADPELRQLIKTPIIIKFWLVSELAPHVINLKDIVADWNKFLFAVAKSYDLIDVGDIRLYKIKRNDWKKRERITADNFKNYLLSDEQPRLLYLWQKSTTPTSAIDGIIDSSLLETKTSERSERGTAHTYFAEGVKKP